jgi:ribosomal protein S15P/S13E
MPNRILKAIQARIQRLRAWIKRNIVEPSATGYRNFRDSLHRWRDQTAAMTAAWKASNQRRVQQTRSSLSALLERVDNVGGEKWRDLSRAIQYLYICALMVFLALIGFVLGVASSDHTQFNEDARINALERAAIIRDGRDLDVLSGELKDIINAQTKAASKSAENQRQILALTHHITLLQKQLKSRR